MSVSQPDNQPDPSETTCPVCGEDAVQGGCGLVECPHGLFHGDDEERGGQPDHSVFTHPDCRCERCMAVYDEWAQQAEGFQRWVEALPAERLLDNFGLVREKAAR